MAEYHRFVSYIYAYENNQKTMSNGFVRVETKEGKCFIYVHMKDLYGNQIGQLKVYIVRRYREKLVGVFLGCMGRRDSQGEFRFDTQQNNIADSGIPLEAMAGIVIIGEQGRKYGTCWDDQQLDLGSFTDKLLPYVKAVKNEEITLSNEKKSSSDEKKSSSDEKKSSSDEEITSSDEKKSSSDEEKSSSDEKITSSNEPEAPINQQTFAAQVAVAPVEEISPEVTLEEKLDYILAQGEKMYPFEDDEVTECIRFLVEDIGKLPMKYWLYAGNSFLMQNYYSYGHLIFGKNKKGQYFLGVPGMDLQKDRFMAKMFGFKNFKSLRNTDKDSGDFGYWYIIM